MITGDKNQLEEYCKRLKCPEHPDAALTVAWHKDGFYVIRCGAGHYPEELVEELPPTRLAKQGKLEPAGDWFNAMPTTDLGTGKALMKTQIDHMVDYAVKYSLDPYRGHVVLMYGKPYIGIDGYLYKANQSKIKYSLTGRPLMPPELESMGYKPADLGWKSTIRFVDTGEEFEGYGFVTMDEVNAIAEGKQTQKRYPVLTSKPGAMVVKRADWQALRRAFPIGESEEGSSETRD